MVSPRPRILDELGAELDRAVRSDAARALPRPRWLHGPLLALIVAFGAGGVAVAGTQLLGEGDPLPPPRPADVVPATAPQPGSARLAAPVASDPSGDRPWRVRMSRTRAGDICTAVGQTVGKRFGIVGLDRVFRASPLGVGDTCSRPPGRRSVTAGARAFAAGEAAAARTVVSGLAGRDVARLELTWRSGRRTLPVGRDRVFLAVLAGYPEDLRPVLRITPSSGGAARRLAIADTGRDEVADLDGGVPWVVGFNAPRRPSASDGPRTRLGLSCVQVTRPGVDGLGPFGPLTPPRCGNLARTPGYSVARRFVPRSEPHDGFSWGLNPARTMVYGAVSRAVIRVELRGPHGLRRRPHVFRPSGAFLVVLDGHVDPRPLRTILTLRDGSTRTLGDSAAIGERGGPLRSVTPPPWRSLASQRRKVTLGFAVPITATVRTGTPIVDPAGGPAWVARSFRAGLAKGVRFPPGARPPRGFACTTVGPLVDGVLRKPTSGAPGPPIVLADEGDVFCNDDKRPTRLSAQVIAYIDNPGGYDLGLSRISVFGQVPRARKIELLGLGAPRSLPLTGDGAFLTLLPGSTRARLRLRATFADGRTLEEQPRGADLTEGGGRVDARTSDPDATAPWAASVTPSRGTLRYGQLVLGRFAYVSPADGSVRFGDAGSADGPALTPKRPIRLIVQRIVARSSSGPTPAQIQRRTRSGRTIVAGAARADVTEVELRTPRDVRVLRPTDRGHAFIAVYDGTFSGGRITATARFHDGRTRTVSQPADFP